MSIDDLVKTPEWIAASEEVMKELGLDRPRGVLGRLSESIEFNFSNDIHLAPTISSLPSISSLTPLCSMCNPSNRMNYITPDEATKTGYRALTVGYELPLEQWLLNNVLADMRRGRIDHVLVESEYGIEVWRK